MPSTFITLRVSPEIKNRLEELAQMLGFNLSEVLRDHVINLVVVQKELEALKTIEKLEKAFVRAFISLPAVQELLGEIKDRYQESVAVCVGFGCNKYVDVVSLFGDTYYVLREEDDIIVPKILEESNICNEYGNCWLDENMPFNERDIETTKELTDFIDYVKWKVEDAFDEKIKMVKRSLERLLG